MNILNSNAENIIKRNIQCFGDDIEFKRPVLNKYQEVEKAFEITLIQRCIYHLPSSYGLDAPIQADSGKTHGSNMEKLLTEYNENIKVEDYCNVGDKFYRIYNISNYQNSDKFIDISLEEVRRELN